MSANAQDALQWLAGQREAMEALLQRIVNTDSNSYDKAGVDAVGALLPRNWKPMASCLSACRSMALAT